MAGRSRTIAADPDAPTRPDVDVLVPVERSVMIDGNEYVIGVMNIKQSIRFTRLCAKLFEKGNAISQQLAAIKDERERNRAFAELDWLGILSEAEIKELLSIILSSRDDVTPHFVGEHWNLEWVLEALALWAEINPLQSYFRSAGKLMTAMGRQMQAAKTTNGTK